jgi:colicin import membrane protein
MAHDFYDLLDIPGNAPAALVKRAYQIRQEAIEADPRLSGPKRQQQLEALRVAYETLSDPDRRAAYDDKRHQSAQASGRGGRWFVMALVLLIVAGAGVAFANYQMRKEEEARIEKQRLADEAARLEKMRAEAEQRRREMLAQERAERERAEQERLEKERQEREAFLATRTFEVDHSTLKNAQDTPQKAREREYLERKQAFEDEVARRRAQAEVERQKRFLREAGRL